MANSEEQSSDKQITNKSSHSAKRDTGFVEISRRERRLRERLLTVDEDVIHDERRLHQNGQRRKEKLASQINRTRLKQEQKLNRRLSSRLYRKSHLLYRLTSPIFAVGRSIRGRYRKMTGRIEHHKAVTPHRSFYLTTHAKAVRQINISGYIRFVHEVGRMIWDNRRLYIKVLIVLTLVLLIVIGLGGQQNYVDMRNALQEVKLGGFLEWVGLMTQAIITSLVVSDANKQMLAFMIVLLSWLVLEYLARHIYSGGGKLKLRDAIYNSSAPLVPLMSMLFMVMVQLLPMAVALISYSSITGAGYINQGIEIENMAAWCILAIIGILTIYWMITSLLSLVTITIPGIYPSRAYFETSILVSGRRVKILFRVLMMFLVLALLWLLVLSPIVVLDATVQFKTMPLVQVITTMLVAASFIWIATYLYMLYRRILDSPEQPIGTPNGRFVWPWQRKKLARKISRQTKSRANKPAVQPTATGQSAQTKLNSTQANREADLSLKNGSGNAN